MENENKSLIPFCFDDHLVRVIEDENGNPWFVAKDVCKILELENVTKALYGLDEDEKADLTISKVSSIGTKQARKVNIISESGLYALVFRSRKPEAKAFSKWVRSVVLPSIRKTGSYCAASHVKPRNAINYAFPEELLSIAQGIKPAMRQRLWRDALDTIRVDGGDFTAACQCFESLCGLMTQSRKFDDVYTLIRRFMDECLEEAKGFNTPSRKIYAIFQLWWQDNGSGACPSMKMLGGYLNIRFESYKSSFMTYRNCRIKCDAA